MKEYISYKFPFVSKSKLKSFLFCKYDFYDQKILKNKQPRREDAIEGTNMHVVFNRFYANLKPEHVFKDEFTDPRIPIHRHPFRKFIYDACMNLVKPDQRGYGKYKNILSNFASIECKRFLRLNTRLHNKQEIFDCFKPLYLEKKLVYKPLFLYGTIDRVNVEVMPNGKKVIAIYDYKTGNVPKSVMTYDENVSGNLSWKLPPYLMKEIHFYAILYALSSGWNVGDEVKDFLVNEDWWFIKKDGMTYGDSLNYKKDYLTSLQKKYKLFKAGKLLKGSDYLIGYYFLNGDKGYRPLKKFNYKSYTSTLALINEYRSCVHHKYYVKHPKFVFNPYGCEKRCRRFEECREKIRRDR